MISHLLTYAIFFFPISLGRFQKNRVSSSLALYSFQGALAASVVFVSRDSLYILANLFPFVNAFYKKSLTFLSDFFEC